MLPIAETRHESLPSTRDTNSQRSVAQPSFSWQEQLSQHASLAPDGMSIVPSAPPQGVPRNPSSGPFLPGYSRMPSSDEGTGVKYMDLLEGSLVPIAERPRSVTEDVRHSQN